MKTYNKTWVAGAFERAIKTAAQTMIAMITTGSVLWEINWGATLGVAATATLLSVLTSIADPMATDKGSKSGKHAMREGGGNE
ncbi:holin [Arcanobacterium buesumense]|uniref:Holin n=1 Tax=Arcanobacterium buesumense TaxID=2722751 RepID=A0A6H2ELQ4_9ACTO|nr:holin [Arcanobacterium buesumense]QJC21997.1 holin [Arcanobacterium buesumense]